MPTDFELYQALQVLPRNITWGEAAKTLAARYNLSEDSVRGRLSRVIKQKRGEAGYSGELKNLAYKTREVDPSIQQQDDILQKAALLWKHIYQNFKTAVFASDFHLPYARFDAIELMFLILQDLTVGVFTVGNDLLDNAAFGRWDDKRPENSKKWTNDTRYMRNMEFSFYRQVKEATGAELVQTQGNHDNWWYSHVRTKLPNMAEGIIADYMAELDSAGVIQFSKGYTEPEVWLSPDLVFWHGQFAGAKVLSNAVNTFKQFTRNGRTPSVVVGHTHRPSLVEGYQVGYNDRTFVNSPCMSRIENVPYIKRNPQGWGLGFVYAEYDQEGYQKLYRIDFIERGSYLVAEFRGKEYRVKLDKSQPKEY